MIDFLDYRDPENQGIIAICQAAVITGCLMTIGVMIYRKMSWSSYNEKRVIYQAVSVVFVLLKTVAY